MRVIVCIKQVPDTNEVRIDPVKGTLLRDGVPSIVNPDDKHALEAALALKEREPALRVTVLSMGPPQAEEALRECLAMGADDAFLLSDRAFAGADTWATSNTLAAAIRKIGDYAVVFSGRQAIDGDTAQVGPQLAERLDLPQVTYVQQIEWCGDGTLRVQRQLEDGHEVVEVVTPCLLTAIKELNQPRYMSIAGIYDAFREKQVTVWGLSDLGLQPGEVGLDASPTQVARSFTPEPKGAGVRLSGEATEVAARLIGELARRHAI